MKNVGLTTYLISLSFLKDLLSFFVPVVSICLEAGYFVFIIFDGDDGGVRKTEKWLFVVDE